MAYCSLNVSWVQIAESVQRTPTTVGSGLDPEYIIFVHVQMDRYWVHYGIIIVTVLVLSSYENMWNLKCQ